MKERTCNDRAPSYYRCKSTYALWVDGRPVGLVHAGTVRIVRDEAIREWYGKHPNWEWQRGVMDMDTKRRMKMSENGGGDRRYLKARETG